MRGSGIPVLVGALIVAGCGGESPSSTATTDLSTAETTTSVRPGETITTVPVVTSKEVGELTTTPSSSSSSTPATRTEEPPIVLAVLRPDGVDEVDFGTSGDDAIAELSAVLGGPDRVEPIEPDFVDCVEGSSWLDCVHALRIIDEGYLAVWDETGLEVALVDSDRDGTPTALQFGDWQATVASGDTWLTTTEGVHPGMTVAALKSTMPGVGFGYNEGALDSFYTASPDRAGYWGRLDWNPATAEIDSGDVSAVQSALNNHGADLVIDGVWGPRTEAAWLTFLAARNIEPVTTQLWLTPEIGAALGLPPDDITVATIEPRPAIGSAAPVVRSDRTSGRSTVGRAP